MRAGRAARGTDRADRLALADMIADADIDPRQVQEGAVQPLAVVEHQQMPLQREGLLCGEDYDAVGGRADDGAGGPRDVGA